MDAETATVYDTATDSLKVILQVLRDWSDMLEGAEREEAIFHINTLVKDVDRFTLAIADYEGTELWNLQLLDTERDKPSTLPVIPNPQ